MALPSPTKTWQIASNLGPFSSGTAPSAAGTMLLALKNALTSFLLKPWVVVSSSNGVTTGATDLWVDSGDFVYGTGNHSWIVLRQTGIASNFQICIDLSDTAPYQMNVLVSSSGGFTGGTIGARPTATDEVVFLGDGVVSGGNWGAIQNAGYLSRLHVWQSTDGEVTRGAIYSNHNNTQQGYFEISKPKDIVSYWADPWVAAWDGSYSTGALYSTFANMSYTDYWFNSRGRLYSMSEMYGAGLVLDNIRAPDDLLTGTQYGISPISLGSSTLGFRGFPKGAIQDAWFFTGGHDYDLVPDDASRQFIVIGDLLLPWDGSIPLKA